MKTPAVKQLPKGAFPDLPIPLPIPYPPMEARRSETLPLGDHWQFEPKWDGFRAIVFRHGEDVVIQSKAGRPLGRYFPELVQAFRDLTPRSFVLDGEIVIPVDGRLSFDDLQLRLHPAESRVNKLAKESPAQFYAFDLLYEPARGSSGRLLVEKPLAERRERLEALFARLDHDSLHLSPAPRDRKTADQWFRQLGDLGLDGVMAKDVREHYHSGDREAMVKIKRLKTVDCVVGGFRYGTSGKDISTLLLGLYDESGNLVHVGHCSSFDAKERKQLKGLLSEIEGKGGFDLNPPGGPSRWSTERSGEWTPVEPRLVCEVRYDYFNQGRFRHGTKFLRWRPDKPPEECLMDQVMPPRSKGRKKLQLPG